MKTVIPFKIIIVCVISLHFNGICQPLDSVIIGNQVWSVTNLNVHRFRNGDPIMQVKTNEDWIKANQEKRPAWCYYNNDSINGNIYGALYNWYAVGDSRDLAPKGWRIPYDVDYGKLARYHELTAHFMKSDRGWVKYGNPDLELYDGNGNNKFGFNGMPSGYRKTDGQFESIGYYTGFWSLSTYDTLTAWNLNLCSSNNGPSLSSEYPRAKGLSVRLIRDEGLRIINDANDKLRIEIENDLFQNKYDTVIDKLNVICFSNGFVYYNDYETLIDCYLITKKPSSAENIFNKVLKLYENDEAKLYNNFGWNLILYSYYTPAIYFLKTALEKYKEDIRLKCRLAHAYLLSGQYETAKKLYIENAIQSDTIENSSYDSQGNEVRTQHPFDNDTTWINMVSKDFEDLKNAGIISNDFAKIIAIINSEIKKKK